MLRFAWTKPILVITTLVVGVTACGSTPKEPAQTASQAPQQDPATTYDRDTVIREATGVFGKGAEGLGKAVERVFADLGQPNAYIVGNEIGGAFIGGLRYGDGKLYHKVEGEKRVHWTGPSIGFDIGGDASKTFTLIYNLNDSEEIFQRFPAVEGKLYLIGGFAVSYHRRGNIVIAPIRLGAGWRLGMNIGWLNYTREKTVVPF
jgi:hypothetical protein